MTTYSAAAVADSVIAHKKGITLQTGRALRDNPIAIAEGAINAPRVDGRALDTHAFDVAFSSTATDVVDLDRVGKIRVDVASFNTGSAGLQVAYSNDNGSSFGSYQTIYSVSGSQAAVGAFYLDLQTGAYAVRVMTSSGGAITTTGTHTVPSDCNAISLKANNADMTGGLTGWIMSGLV